MTVRCWPSASSSENFPRTRSRPAAGRQTACFRLICCSGAHFAKEAMADPIVFAGTVEWSGENPGISLKESPDGPFVVLASFFRVVLSPHGRGHALVLLQSPHEGSAPGARGNYCFHDNEALARYLVKDFVSHFGAYKGLPGLRGLVYQELDKAEA